MRFLTIRCVDAGVARDQSVTQVHQNRSGSLDKLQLWKCVAHAPEHHATQPRRRGQYLLSHVSRLSMPGNSVHAVDDRYYARPRPYAAMANNLTGC